MSNKPLNIKNYGSIPHLSGSKLGPSDKTCEPAQERLATVEFTPKFKTQKPLIIVEEKLDGSNVGITKVNGVLVPLTRAGYRAETSPWKQHHLFARWVFINYRRFERIIGEGERLVGEWLLQAHGTRYILPHEPFVMLDYFTAENKRIRWAELNEKATQSDLVRPNVFGAYETPVHPDSVTLCLYTSGHGAIGPAEGAVWRVETERKGFVFICKYVRSDYVPGLYMEDEIFNEERAKAEA